MWDDLLGVAASVKGGHVIAALVAGKLRSSRRQQNALAAAIKEYSALRHRALEIPCHRSGHRTVDELSELNDRPRPRTRRLWRPLARG